MDAQYICTKNNMSSSERWKHDLTSTCIMIKKSQTYNIGRYKAIFIFKDSEKQYHGIIPLRYCNVIILCWWFFCIVILEFYVLILRGYPGKRANTSTKSNKDKIILFQLKLRNSFPFHPVFLNIKSQLICLRNIFGMKLNFMFTKCN